MHIETNARNHNSRIIMPFGKLKKIEMQNGPISKPALVKRRLKIIRVINQAFFLNTTQVHFSEFGFFWAKKCPKMNFTRNNSDNFPFGHEPNSIAHKCRLYLNFYLTTK